MTVRIYQPTKSATQSGRANSQHWLVEFVQTGDREMKYLNKLKQILENVTFGKRGCV